MVLYNKNTKKYRFDLDISIWNGYKIFVDRHKNM